MQQKPERIILGIDPGTNLMGFGVINGSGKQPGFMDMGVLNLRGEPDHYLKLKRIYDEVLHLIDTYLPDEMAIEAPFFGKNVQSMLKLGRAQGIAIAGAMARSLPVFEYAPRKIKLAITSEGDASKEQVAGMLQHMFRLKEIPGNLDATDGLAVAVCHFYQKEPGIKKSGAGNWEEFIRKNPGRVK